MIFNRTLDDCYQTVIASMAHHIESLQSEIGFKQRAIEQLELICEDLRIKLERTTGEAVKFVPEHDPFEEDDR